MSHPNKDYDYQELAERLSRLKFNSFQSHAGSKANPYPLHCWWKGAKHAVTIPDRGKDKLGNDLIKKVCKELGIDRDALDSM